MEWVDEIGAWVVLVALAGAGVVLAVGAAVRQLLDHSRTEVVEGRVRERKIDRGGMDDPTVRYWLAVDGGGRPGVVTGDDYARVVPGAQVRLHLTPRGRQVKRLDVIELPAPANEFPAEWAGLYPRGTEDLLVSPEWAAAALRAPVEAVAVAPDTPDTRRYVYVPVGTKVIDGMVLPPALHVTEAFDPEAANEVARRVTAGRRRTWHHGNRGVFQAGMTYLMTWGPGALVIRGQVEAADIDEIGRLAHRLTPPRPGRG